MTKSKQQKLSIKEKLEQVLVPEDEQPYEVPSNWAWIKLLEAFDNLTSSNKKLLQKNYLQDGNYAVVDQGKELIGGFTNKDNLLFDGELPIVLFGDHTRIVKYIDFPFVQGADGVKILKPRHYYEAKFFYYLMQNIDIPDLGYRRHFPLFPTLSCVLAPIAEQKRIIDRIESLFEKLDNAKELAQNALDTFETRKAAILHKAFTGELTAQWREKNGIDFEKEWGEKELGACGDWYGGGTPSKNCPDYWENGNIIWVSPKDMKSMCIEDTEDKITEIAIEYSSARLIQEEAILFVVRSGILRRILPIAMTTKPVTVNQDMKALVPKGINIKYLYWFCVCHESDIRIKCAKSGTTVESINSELLYKYMAVIPSIKEQEEIVRILENLLEKEQKAQDLCDVIDKIDLMKKAILARAFRGELGTNDPNEESAIELLKECLK